MQLMAQLFGLGGEQRIGDGIAAMPARGALQGKLQAQRGVAGIRAVLALVVRLDAQVPCPMEL